MGKLLSAYQRIESTSITMATTRMMLLRNNFQAVRLGARMMLCFSTVGLMAINNSDSGAKEPKVVAQHYVTSMGDDRNDGTASHPWATLQHAAAKVKPGSVVHVAPGVYAGGITCSASGNPAARIRFVSDAKWSARIRSVGSYATWTNDGDFVDIVGFDVSGDGAIGLLNRGSNVRIISNHVHDVPARGCTGNGGAGILNGNYSAMDNDIVGNVVHDIGEANKSCARVHGIYHSNLRGHILNNISYGNQGYGIHLWHAAAEVTIAHNLVFNNRHGGILIGTGDAPYQGSALHPVDRILVANNIVIYNQNRYGIEELGITGDHNVYLNNLVFGNNFADWKLRTGRQSGTITADPRFIAYRADGTGDYHLSTVSPALGTGTSLGAPEFDIEGHARPRDGAWDIGPYQSGTSVKYPWPPHVCRPDCNVNPHP